MDKYKGPVCRGCWQLGNNCKICERCIETKPTILATRTDATPVAWMPMTSSPADEPILAAIKVNHKNVTTWWERHIIVIDSETGTISDMDFHHGWEAEDYEFWQPLPANPDHIPDATHPPATDVAALVDAAKDLRDAIAHMAAPARVDPDKYFSEQVKAFGDAFGYGALMTTASALWRQDLGDLQGGEFAVGPCVTTAANQLKRLDTALAPFTKGQNDE